MRAIAHDRVVGPTMCVASCISESRWRMTLLAGAIGCCLATQTSVASAADGRVNDPKAGSVQATEVAGAVSNVRNADAFESVEWAALMPKDWDSGTQDFKSLGLALMGDDDPRAKAELERMKRSWGEVPVEASMNHRHIRIAGFVVPLDPTSARGTRELLLVPYFGACIHSPPPPANQVIHVRLAAPIAGIRMMDSIWVSGTLQTETTETDMGRAGYALDAQFVTPIAAARPDWHDEARMRQMMPMLAAVLTPLLVVTAWMAWLIKRDMRRTPREFKLAARQRRLAEKQRRRDSIRRHDWTMNQYLSRLARLLRRDSRPRSRSR